MKYVFTHFFDSDTHCIVNAENMDSPPIMIHSNNPSDQHTINDLNGRIPPFRALKYWIDNTGPWKDYVYDSIEELSANHFVDLL